MSWLSFFGMGQRSGSDGYGDDSYTNDPLLGVYRDLTYLDCRNIYRYWPLGKRIASALPHFALSAPRQISFGEAPDLVIDQFNKTCKDLQIDEVVCKAAIYARVYGLSAVCVASNQTPIEQPLTQKAVINEHITFNVLDPLAIRGFTVEQDPTSTNYLKPLTLSIWGKEPHKARVHLCFNDIPLYYQFNPSSFTFSGASVYQNMTLLIRSWNRCVVALQRVATKAGSIVKTSKETATFTGAALRIAERNLELIRKMENDGIMSCQNGEDIKGLEMTGIDQIDSIISQLQQALMMALSDTPSGILLDKNLSVGLNDGTEDMKAILMAVGRFREMILKTLYDFLDHYVLYLALTPGFIKELKEEYPDLYRSKSPAEILEELTTNFTWEWGNLYPLNDKEQSEADLSKLEILKAAKEIGVTAPDLEEELNSLKIFKEEVTVEEIKEDTLGDMNEAGGDGDDFGGSHDRGDRANNSDDSDSSDASGKHEGLKDEE